MTLTEVLQRETVTPVEVCLPVAEVEGSLSPSVRSSLLWQIGLKARICMQQFGRLSVDQRPLLTYVQLSANSVQVLFR